MASSATVLADAGPLAASLNRRDQYHAWAAATLEGLEMPMVTCEAVLSEAPFLVSSSGGNPARLVDFVASGVRIVRPVVAAAPAHIAALMRKYADVPMSLADAALVALSEDESDSTVFTADSDFQIYRRHGREAIPLLFPGA